MKKCMTAVFVCMGLMLACLGLAGCGPEKQAPSSDGPAFAQVTDDAGRTVTIKEKPQRIVALSTSLLNFADAVDGNLAGRASVQSDAADLPERYSNVPEVGPVYNVSVEKIMACQPDLVLANKNQHEKLIPLLEQNGVTVLALTTKTYDDVKRNLTLVGKLYGKEDMAQEKIAAMDKEIQAVKEKIPDNHLTVAILHATPSHVSLELDKSIAGDAARILGFTNVAQDGADKVGNSAEKVPYSMEALVEKDPDVIFITSMGRSDKIEERLRQDVESSPAWQTLTAVRQKRVYVLPENLFLLNTGLDYPQAVAYMAKTVYPEVFH